MKQLYITLAAASLLCSACVSGVQPGTYIKSSTSSQKGLVTQVETEDGSAVVASPEARVGSMKGVAIRHSILFGLVSWGSAGVGEAAQKATSEFRYRNSPDEGIREVDTVAKGGVRVLWGLLYCNEQVIVTGEGETLHADTSKQVLSK